MTARRATVAALIAAGVALIAVAVVLPEAGDARLARPPVGIAPAPAPTPPTDAGASAAPSAESRRTPPPSSQPASSIAVATIEVAAPGTTPATSLPATGEPGTSAAAAPAPTPVAPARVDLIDAAVAADIVPVGVLPDGRLQLPDDPTVVGWWSGGSSPGSPAGRVVLAGHVDSQRFGLGTFAALRDVRPGAAIVVTDRSGEAHLYRVSGVEQIVKQELPAELFAADQPPGLVLVTCGGEFDRERRTYADNIIVTAEPW